MKIEHIEQLKGVGDIKSQEEYSKMRQRVMKSVKKDINKIMSPLRFTSRPLRFKVDMSKNKWV